MDVSNDTPPMYILTTCRAPVLIDAVLDSATLAIHVVVPTVYSHVLLLVLCGSSCCCNAITGKLLAIDTPVG